MTEPRAKLVVVYSCRQCPCCLGDEPGTCYILQCGATTPPGRVLEQNYRETIPDWCPLPDRQPVKFACGAA
jgi:hypothetical protein